MLHRTPLSADGLFATSASQVALLSALMRPGSEAGGGARWLLWMDDDSVPS